MTRSRPSAASALLSSCLLFAACGAGESGEPDVRQTSPIDVLSADARADAGPSCVPSPEVCNGLDDDCDGRIDNNAQDAIAYYQDTDGDGAGTGTPIVACRQDGNLTPTAGDCDDNNRFIFPGAVELCDGIDNDCSGVPDDGDSVLQFRDADGDGVGNAACVSSLCTPLEGFVTFAGDCDDNDSTIGARADCPPDAVEQALPRFVDRDGDGFGAEGAILYDCGEGDRSADNALDCDDRDAETFPGAIDLCDGIDQDCDGADNCPEGISVRQLVDADVLQLGQPGSRLGDVLHAAPAIDDLGPTVFAPFGSDRCSTLRFAPPFAAGAQQTLSLCSRQASFDSGSALFCDYTSCDAFPTTGSPLRYRAPQDIARPHLRLGPLVQFLGVDARAVVWEAEPFTREESVVALYDPAGGDPVWSQRLDSRALRIAGLDANLDASADVLVADLEQGTVNIWFGPLDESALDSPADVQINVGGRAGTSLLTADVMGTDALELLIGAPETRQNGERVGAVFVFALPLTQRSLDAQSATMALYGDQVGAQFGTSLAALPEIGLYVGAPQSRFGAVAGGAVLRFGLPLVSASPQSFIYGNVEGAAVGSSLATTEASGQPTVFIGAPGTTRNTGTIYRIAEAADR